MKAFKFLSNTAFVFSLVVLASCSSDNDIEETKTVAKKIEFKAIINSNDTEDTEASSKVTRATLEDDYTVSWDDNDGIAVFCDNNEEAVGFGITPSSVDGSTATFTNYGEVLPFWFDPNGFYYALYPNTSAATLNIGYASITSVLPTNQTVSSGRTYDKKALFMAACADKDERIFNFKNIPALIKVTISNNGDGKVKFIEIESKNSANILSGNFEVAPDYYNRVTIRPVSGADKKHTVKLQIPESADAQDFYLAVLPGRFDGLTLKFESASGVVAKHEGNKAVEFKRSKIYDFGSYDIEKEIPEVK